MSTPDVEGGKPQAPAKPAPKPRAPSVALPRMLAGLAIVTLLAVPVVVPVVVMKMTGKSGKQW